MKDHYKILGLAPTSSQADIKKAYRLLALQYHPDKNNGDKASEERFKDISVSYSILIDEDTRNEYDYIKGYKTTYRNLRTQPGAPSPVQFLTQFQRIKGTVLNAGGRINKQALFKVLNDLLSDANVEYLVHERDILTNNLITDEIFTCCVFLTAGDKAILHKKLEKLANGDPKFAAKLAIRQQDTHHKNTFTQKTVDSTAERTPITTVLIFIMFLILFLVLLFVAA